ncbi:MAG: 4Fe-4S ferredoxin [Desulfobacteraceae bacterium IS3]|nr:MAG: 4Fe-4S ferredoxin [Desulfobacteraceae bacterium IS3]HAO19827.1 4Fe-4S ferredoxin [Desulfobacteraceae bacterium]
MEMNRRYFLKLSGAIAAPLLIKGNTSARASEPPRISAEAVGCLVDTTECVGCRKCEQACNERHGLDKPSESFEEMTVLENERRPDETSYTVVNKYYPKNIGSLTWRNRPSFVKFQCMHCNDPSCVSACIVGALTKQPDGPVIYDAAKCIGCRYCMIACPFQIPAYEYGKPLTPQVRKCTFCFEYIKDGGLPACAQICPREVMTFGRHCDLLKLAHRKMKDNPGKYVDHIYGEYEVGGTSWLYLSSEPFESIGFPKLGTKVPPRLTEAIQHGLFQYFAAPIGLFAILGGMMWFSNFYKKNPENTASEKGDKT